MVQQHEWTGLARGDEEIAERERSHTRKSPPVAKWASPGYCRWGGA